jgi:hypothetical protein
MSANVNLAELPPDAQVRITGQDDHESEVIPINSPR